MDKRNTEEAIMRAAEEEFLDKGYKLATTTKIAQRAGVTHAMLHYYFRTKEQIFLKVLDKNLGELFAYQRNMMVLGTSFWVTFSGGVSVLFDFFKQHKQLLGLLYDVVKQNPELLLRYKENVVDMLSHVSASHQKMLESEIAAGRCNPISYEQIIFQVAGMTISTFLLLPFVENVIKINEAAIDELLERRKEEIIRTLHYRLYAHLETEA